MTKALHMPSSSASTEATTTKESNDTQAAKDSVWQPCWDPNSSAYYYWNTTTNETTWENPYRNLDHSGTVPDETTETEKTSHQNPNPSGSGTGTNQVEYYPGYDHRSFPAASLAGATTFNEDKVVDAFFEKVEQVKRQSQGEDPSTHVPDPEDLAIARQFELRHGYQSHSSYSSRGRYNPKTGLFESDPMSVGPERFAPAARMQRQCDFFFDYKAYAHERGTDPEGGKVKMTKKELTRAIRKRKEKKELNKRKWLLGID